MSFQEIINPSTLFLLTGIKLTTSELKKYGFISAYAKDINHDIFYERPVYLLFKPSDISKMESFIHNEYRKDKTSIKEDYDYPGGYIVLVYSFPEHLEQDYHLFLMGEYSKFSDFYKSMFSDYSKVRFDSQIDPVLIPSLPFRIFNKTPDLKEYLESSLGINIDPSQELWSSPSLDGKDCLDISKVISD
jgi:hypothetical protein